MPCCLDALWLRRRMAGLKSSSTMRLQRQMYKLLIEQKYLSGVSVGSGGHRISLQVIQVLYGWDYARQKDAKRKNMPLLSGQPSVGGIMFFSGSL